MEIGVFEVLGCQLSSGFSPPTLSSISCLHTGKTTSVFCYSGRWWVSPDLLPSLSLFPAAFWTVWSFQRRSRFPWFAVEMASWYDFLENLIPMLRSPSSEWRTFHKQFTVGMFCCYNNDERINEIILCQFHSAQVFFLGNNNSILANFCSLGNDKHLYDFTHKQYILQCNPFLGICCGDRWNT